MSTIRGSARFYAGLLPVEPSDEPSPLRPTFLENDRFHEPSLRKRASRDLARFLMAFCLGVGAAVAWQSYGDGVRQMIANSYSQLGWSAPRRALTAQKIPDAPQLDAMLRDLHEVRRSLDRIAAGQELITRSTDEIATSIAAGQEQKMRSSDQTATSTASGQEPTTRSADQTVTTAASGQEQMTRSTDQTATSIDQPPSAKASSITVESRGTAISLQPTVRLDIRPTEARPPQTLSERGKQFSAASEHDPAFRQLRLYYRTAREDGRPGP
jgi:hypothetical protein